MGRKTKKSDYQDLIREERKEIQRRIKQTNKPIFNLWRLVREPCRSSSSCPYQHLDVDMSEDVLKVTVILITLAQAHAAGDPPRIACRQNPKML